jgi:hypothetical protein
MLENQKKSIKNVLRSLTLTTSLLLSSLALTGCVTMGSFFPFGKKEEVKPITVVTVPQEKTPLALENPAPLRLKPVDWIVVTPQNWEEVFKQMQAKEQNLVLFGLTSDGYQALAVTIAELRNLINTQRIIIDKYKEYYEPKKSDTK